MKKNVPTGNHPPPPSKVKWSAPKLLNFETNFRTSQRSSEYYSEKLAEIDCNMKIVASSGIKL